MSFKNVLFQNKLSQIRIKVTCVKSIIHYSEICVNSIYIELL